MAEYLCPFCNSRVTYGQDHPCSLFMIEDSVFLPRRLEESDKKDEKHDDDKDKFMGNLDDNSRKFSGFQQNESEKSEQICSLIHENKDKVSFIPASNRKRKFSTLSEEISNKTKQRNTRDTSFFFGSNLNVQVFEDHSKENAVLNTSSENVEPDSISECDFHGASKSKSFTSGYVSEKIERNVSNFLSETASKKFELLIEESKWQTLNYDKKLFMDSLECSTLNPGSDNKNISESNNLIVSYDFSKGNKNLENDMIKMTGVLTHGLSQVHRKNQKMAANVKEPMYSKENDKVVAGTPGMACHKKNFVCDICSKQFIKKRDLHNHYRTHTGEKPFQCSLCEKEFSHKGNLHKHYRIHTGEKPFVCDICEKKFTLKSTLDNHYRTHTGDKPFVCDVCKKSFAQISTVTIHVRTHTGEKPYICPICGKSFTNNSDCNKHRRRMHE